MSGDAEKKFYLSRLGDQSHLLRTAIKGMRAGDLTQGLTVATVIRVLVHETKKSTPLLKILASDYLALPIRDWIRNPRNTIVNLPLCAKISSNEPHISLTADLDWKALDTVMLEAWWNEPFVRMPIVGEFSRRELILGLANKEGAHVDADLSEKYLSLLESKFFQARVNDRVIDSLNLSRLLAGSSGALLLDCVERNFPALL
jgi:hypothetical protein